MAALASMLALPQAEAQQRPNIILILSDDFGYGDSGPYGGGPGRGMPTPSLYRFQWIREQVGREGISLPLPSGNQFSGWIQTPGLEPGGAPAADPTINKEMVP